MKHKLHRSLQTGLLSAACSLMLLGAASIGSAQSTSTTNTFDSATSTASFVNNWWGIGPTITWDGTLDAANDSGSGSVKYVAPFTGAASEQFMTHFTIANRWGWDAGTVINAVAYTNLSFDIKVDPTSAITPGGHYGYLEIGLTSWVDGDPNDIWTAMNTIGWNIPLSATGWTHHDIPVNVTWPGIDSVVGFYVKMWSNGAHTNTLTFNLDNVMLTKPTAPVVIPPPTASLSKATTGLNLINTTSAGANGRQNIHPVNPSYSWVGVANPVSFKITIKDYPITPTGYQTHLFLAPQSSLPYGAGDTSVDWNCTNLVFVQIQNTPGGAGEMTFMYKTNFGSGWGGQIFGSNNLGAVSSSVMKGTWTVTFANDTDITITAPDNTTTNLTMPADSAAMFAGPVFAWIGSQANGSDKVGLSSIIERIEITGFPADNVDDNFPGPGLDTNVWVVSASDQAGVQVVPASTAYWLNWTVPDVGFRAQSSPLIGTGAVWTDLGSPTVLFNAQRHTQVSLVSSSSGYFRLVKRVPSLLQVLMPGETNAPGTVTGKTGTMDPVGLGVITTVKIHSVDPDWNIASGVNHTVHLTISPEDPGNFVDPDVALANGTANIMVQINIPGTYTITATDVTDGSLTPGVSSTITVSP